MGESLITKMLRKRAEKKVQKLEIQQIYSIYAKFVGYPEPLLLSKRKIAGSNVGLSEDNVLSSDDIVDFWLNYDEMFPHGDGMSEYGEKIDDILKTYASKTCYKAHNEVDLGLEHCEETLRELIMEGRVLRIVKEILDMTNVLSEVDEDEFDATFKRVCSDVITLLDREIADASMAKHERQLEKRYGAPGLHKWVVKYLKIFRKDMKKEMISTNCFSCFFSFE